MKIKILSFILLIISLFCFTVSPIVISQSSSWITSIQVYDITTASKVLNSSQLIAGDTYNVTITISIPFTNPSNTFYITLNPSLERYGAQFWYILTPNYQGYNAKTFQPTNYTISFIQYSGSLVLSAVFTIPSNFTDIGSINGVILQKPQQLNIIVITVGQSNVGQYTATIVSQEILEYYTLYSKAVSLIQSGEISPQYKPLVESILNNSSALYSQGLVSQAISELQLINPSYYPSPPSNLLLYATIGVAVMLAVIAAFGFIMYFRTKGYYEDLDNTRKDIIKELSSIKVVAARYDKNLAEEIEKLINTLNKGRSK
ncbi:hypothetical protein [Saccharolobus caldissimus]|uniref:TFIIS central domain-containing protein n=1 Tax=Saccharolobus caldissimus TaxID=1702097 RepID=A0AAQ4CT07_9CREN|nr:hypothetical protein [Saccharolobus caldissimus]BDB98938.1 hypothetical protein SACC_19550 [Saccharolobus caldissimus]